MFAGPYKTLEISQAEIYFYRETLTAPLAVSIQYPRFGFYAHAIITPSRESLINLWISSVLSDDFLTQISLNITISWGTTAHDKTTHSDAVLSFALDEFSRPIMTVHAIDEQNRMFYQKGETEKKICVSDFTSPLTEYGRVRWTASCLKHGNKEMLSRVLNMLPLGVGVVM